MFTQVCSMYDEFRIRSMKLKVTPMQTSLLPSGQLVLNTCWDRNGRYKQEYWMNDGGRGYKTEDASPQISSYSSFTSKPLLQYQSGVVYKTLSAAGFPDNLWMPCSLQQIFQNNAAYANGVWQPAGAQGNGAQIQYITDMS